MARYALRSKVHEVRTCVSSGEDSSRKNGGLRRQNAFLLAFYQYDSGSGFDASAILVFRSL